MTPRLRFLLSKADPRHELWDIGCDHGYLGLDALRQGFPRVHFVDPAVHLIEKLERQLRFQFANAVFHSRRGQDLDLPVSGSVVMAGFGGDQMREILEAWQKRGVLNASHLILSPHKDEEAFAAWLESVFGLVSKDSVTERGRIRPVFHLSL